jgi:ADP-ribosylglycohydrolase
MLGAIAGDIIGSPYEAGILKTNEFLLFSAYSSFTDDTVLTVAVADTLLYGGDYVENFQRYFETYPLAGYSSNFAAWAASGYTRPYNSFGNGSAMRVSPVGFAFDTLEETLAEAKRSAEVTHNHPEGIKGAQATAGAIFLGRAGKSKAEIREYVESAFGYDLEEPLNSIRPWYTFDIQCIVCPLPEKRRV